MADTSNEFGTVIGVDANFKGDLAFDSAAKVLGKFEGSIQSKGKVYIADGSNCKAKIAAKEVAIEGTVEGNVEASERIELKPTARITGDIVAARMTMSDGAALDGHVRIGLDGADSRARSTAEAKPASQSQSGSGGSGSGSGGSSQSSGSGQQTAKARS